MRIIPGKTKVQIELFRGVSLWDMLVAAIALIMTALIVVSNLPAKLVFLSVHLILSAVLLARFDNEPNYLYLISIIRHFGYKRKFKKSMDDEKLFAIRTKGEYNVYFDELFPEKSEEEQTPEESPEERRARKKAEKAEWKADEKLLKSKKLTKEQEDAIWLKRANQSQTKKQERSEKRSAGEEWSEMKDLSSFTGIKDGYIEFGGQYYGAALEIPCVEFRFFSEYRRSSAIENGVGAVLRMVHPDYSANLVKIERPINYDDYVTNEYEKLDELRKSYEEAFISEEELKSRVAVVYDRINTLLQMRSDNKVIVPCYYLVLYDSDKRQLENTVRTAEDCLRRGEMMPRRLGSRDLALFLKYSNTLDFDESEVDKLREEEYALWAMPSAVEFRPRVSLVDKVVTHNFHVVSYPTVVWDAWLASLMTYPSVKVVLKMKPMDSGKAINAIDRSLSELRATVASARTDSAALEAQTHLETLQNLLTTLQGDNETLLDVNIYVTAYDVVANEENPKYPDLEKPSFRARVTNMKKAVRRAWNEAGFRLNNMEFNQAVAYIGSQISGYDPLAGKGRGIPSNTIAASFPWIFPHVMDEKGVQLGSSDGVPVFVDFFARNSERINSNMVIVGKSGSGKSFATKDLLANLAADDAKIFVLDPEDEYTALAKNLNGKCINVGNAQYGRLNPFHIITGLEDEEEGSATSSYATHLQFLEEFFRQILPDCDKDSLEYLNSLVDRIYMNKGIHSESDLSYLKPEDYPIFDDLYDEILREFQRTDNDYIRSMLRTLMNYVSKFATGGRNAVIWNGPSSITTEENFVVFNFQSLLANRNSAVANAQMLLVLKYLDNEIIKNRAYNEKYGLNRKIVVVIDEAHVFIDTKFPVALDFMFQLAKRIRKYNGMQIVITQNIKDFVGSEEIARKSTAIINACQYSFIFALSPNDMGDLCTLYEKAGGINEHEQEQIVQAGRGEAFTIMSPTSRSSFKIKVPAGVQSLFEDRDYQNPYFDGENGSENWEAFMRDSREKLQQNLEERPVKAEAAEVFDKLPESAVSFDEMSEEEYESLFAAKPAKEAEVVFEEVKDAFEEEEFVPETPEEFAARRAAAYAEMNPPSRTEEILAELVGKLGTQNMASEIRRVVREEVEKVGPFTVAAPMAAPAQPAAFEPAPAPQPAEFFEPEEDSADLEDFDTLLSGDSREEEEEDDFSLGAASLGSIFDFAGLDDLDDEEDYEDESEEDDEGDGFDIMSFLASQAETQEEEESDNTVESFIHGTETKIQVSLDQLMGYLKSKR